MNAKKLIQALLELNGSKMMTVHFIKRTNGEPRTMRCNPRAGRVGTELGKRARVGGTMGYDPLEKGLLPVIDLDLLRKDPENPRKAWRNINFTQGPVTIKALGGTIELLDGEVVV